MGSDGKGNSPGILDQRHVEDEEGRDRGDVGDRHGGGEPEQLRVGEVQHVDADGQADDEVPVEEAGQEEQGGGDAGPGLQEDSRGEGDVLDEKPDEEDQLRGVEVGVAEVGGAPQQRLERQDREVPRRAGDREEEGNSLHRETVAFCRMPVAKTETLPHFPNRMLQKNSRKKPIS